MQNKFLKTIALLVFAVAAISFAFYTASPASAEGKKVAFSLEKAEKLKTVDGWTILKIKENEILFIRDTETSVRALSADCTHQKCKLSYNPEKKLIECPCHQSTFDLDGKPLSGPAKEPLKKYEAKLEGDKVIVTLE
ncbi:MAG: Rieske (2Fe-2S) protein [Phycisphaerae bacterium]|nr:Rieske (2Fe-2S) protein [Phycisphaerae bacterium]